METTHEFKEHDVVRVRGTDKVGTIIHIHDGNTACAVEFCSARPGNLSCEIEDHYFTELEPFIPAGLANDGRSILDLALLCDIAELLKIPEGETSRERIYNEVEALTELRAGLASDSDSEIAKAHNALSEALENPDAGNDDVRDTAIDMCAALNALQERCKKLKGELGA